MLVLAVAAAPVWSDGQALAADQPRARQASGISADRAAELARQATGGRVLSVRASGEGFEVKVLLDDGRVRNVRVDANGSVRD